MSLLEFMFTDVWHFAGCFAILLVLASLFTRRPNVTNFYEVVPRNGNEEEASGEEVDEAVEEQARTDMWKHDV